MPSTAGVCAQTELGLTPFRTKLYHHQLKFYFRILQLPESSWAKQCLLDHMSFSWPSPYLKYIYSIRDEVNLPFVPPTTKYLDLHLTQWSLGETNFLISQKILPNIFPLVKYQRQPYVFEQDFLGTLAGFRLSNAGLGNRFQRNPDYEVTKRCPVCGSMDLSESHVIFACPAIEHVRAASLVNFRRQCQGNGHSVRKSFKLWVNGYDCKEQRQQDVNFVEIGCFMESLRDYWFGLW